jgi:hypothetical protein
MIKNSIVSFVLASTSLATYANSKSSLAVDAFAQTSLMKRIASVDCVLSVDHDLTISIPSSIPQPTGDLAITLKSGVDSFVCSTTLVKKVEGLQLLSVFSEMGVILAKGETTKVGLPRDLKSKLSKVDCVVSVEDEFVAGIPEENQGTLGLSGNLLVTIEDEFNASSCAKDIYKRIPGAQIDAQFGPIFRVLGTK